ncbi:MAG: hypothetical protein RLZ79_366 [Pseudomonadota bacterium]|jgi:hypothetical protein
MNQTVSTTANFDLRAHMPLLARQAGVWAGVYRYYDADGNKIDEHRSRLICRIPDSGPHHYHQTNEYTWSDGRQEIREFKGSFRDGKLWFDSELIEGWAAEEPLDEHRRTLLLYWVRRGETDTYLYEMIQVDDACRQRTRVWQWIRGGATRMRTLIDEVKVADDWRSVA